MCNSYSESLRLSTERESTEGKGRGDEKNQRHTSSRWTRLIPTYGNVPRCLLQGHQLQGDGEGWQHGANPLHVEFFFSSVVACWLPDITRLPLNWAPMVIILHLFSVIFWEFIIHNSSTSNSTDNNSTISQMGPVWE